MNVATPEERVRAMADLANEITNERAREDGVLTDRSDINAGREIERRYGDIRRAMMEDLADEQEALIARMPVAVTPEEYRTHDERRAATERAHAEIRRVALASGMPTEEVNALFHTPPSHVRSAEEVEAQRQDAIERAAASSAEPAGSAREGVDWPPRRGQP